MVLAVPVQDSFTVGEVLTAALMNKNVRDAVGFLEAPPIFVGWQATPQNFTSGTAAAVAFDSENVDTYGGHSTSVNNTLYTATVAGWYLAIARVDFAGTTTGRFIVSILQNGVAPIPTLLTVTPALASSVAIEYDVCGLLNLGVGDTVSVAATQNSGGTLATLANGCSLTLLWVHS